MLPIISFCFTIFAEMSVRKNYFGGAGKPMLIFIGFLMLFALDAQATPVPVSNTSAVPVILPAALPQKPKGASRQNGVALAQQQQPPVADNTAVALGNEEPPLAIKKLCRQPSEPGSCSQSIKRFYYSSHSRHCLEFIYGGCQGNENNFENQTECESTCQNVKPCPYIPWVPGCDFNKKGENTDGCDVFEMSCEQKEKSTTESRTVKPTTTTTLSSKMINIEAGKFSAGQNQNSTSNLEDVEGQKNSTMLKWFKVDESNNWNDTDIRDFLKETLVANSNGTLDLVANSTKTQNVLVIKG